MKDLWEVWRSELCECMHMAECKVEPVVSPCHGFTEQSQAASIELRGTSVYVVRLPERVDASHECAGGERVGDSDTVWRRRG